MQIDGIQIQVGANLDDFDREIKKLSTRLGDLGGNLKDVGGNLTQSITAPLVGLGAASLAAFGKFDSLKKGLTAVTGSADKAAVQFEQLQKIARQPGLGLAEVAKGAINLQTVGFSAAKAQKAIAEFGNAVASVGGGREQFEGAIYGLQQLANTEFPLGEDLNIIKDAIPQVTPLLKEAFGTARTEDLQKLGITSEQVVNTIINGLGKLDRAQGGISNSFENLTDTFVSNGAKIGESINTNFNVEGKINTFADALTGLTDAFVKLSPEAQGTITVVAGLAAATGPVLFGIGAVTKALPTLIAGLTTLKNLAFSTTGLLGGLAAALVAYTAINLNEFLTAPDNADRLLAEQTRYTEEYKKLSKERQQAAAEELVAASNNERRIVEQSKRAIEAFQSLNSEIRKRAGIDGSSAFNFKAIDPAVSKSLAENQKKIDDYQSKLGIANGKLEVFQARLAGIKSTGKDAATSLEEVADATAKIGDDKIAAAMAAIEKALSDADKKAKIFGSTFDLLGEKAGILTSGISQLIELGLPLDKVQAFQDRLDQLNLNAFKASLQGASLDQLTGGGITLPELKTPKLDNNDFGLKTLIEVQKEFRKASEEAAIFGKSFDLVGAQSAILEEGIRSLIDNGFTAESAAVLALQQQLEQLVKSKGVIIDLGPILQAGITDTITSFAELAGQALITGGSFDSVATALMTGIGDMLINLGKAAIQAGVTKLAIDAVLSGLPGGVAIAAGIAAVAFGQAAKSGAAQANASRSGGGGSPSSNRPSGGSAGGGNVSVSVRQPQQSASQSLRVEVTGELIGRGRDLVGVIKTEEKQERRVGANG